MVVCVCLKSVVGEMFAELTEVESGRKNDRAQLKEVPLNHPPQLRGMTVPVP
jgi:hypothetical protein